MPNPTSLLAGAERESLLIHLGEAMDGLVNAQRSSASRNPEFLTSLSILDQINLLDNVPIKLDLSPIASYEQLITAAQLWLWQAIVAAGEDDLVACAQGVQLTKTHLRFLLADGPAQRLQDA